MPRTDLLEICCRVDWANYMYKVTVCLNTIPRKPVGTSRHEIIFGTPKTIVDDEHALISDLNQPLSEKSERKEYHHKEVAELQRD